MMYISAIIASNTTALTTTAMIIVGDTVELLFDAVEATPVETVGLIEGETEGSPVLNIGCIDEDSNSTLG